MSVATLVNSDPVVISFDNEGKESPKLDARCRCDKGGCGAQAYVEVAFASANILVFCSHHAAELKPMMFPLAVQWYSEESRLIEKRHTGPEN